MSRHGAGLYSRGKSARTGWDTSSHLWVLFRRRLLSWRDFDSVLVFEKPRIKTADLHFPSGARSFAIPDIPDHGAPFAARKIVSFAESPWERVRLFGPKRHNSELINSASHVSRQTREFESWESVGLYRWISRAENQLKSSRWFWTTVPRVFLENSKSGKTTQKDVVWKFYITRCRPRKRCERTELDGLIIRERVSSAQSLPGFMSLIYSRIQL